MLCLDIKLVSRLRGVSLTSGSSTNVSAVSLSVSSTSSTTVGIEKKNFSSKRNKGVRDSCAGNGNSVTESDSDEETLPASRTIQRNRSRSVCVPALSSAARCTHLHRRSSHHAYVPLKHSLLSLRRKTAERYVSLRYDIAGITRAILYIRYIRYIRFAATKRC